MHGQEDAVTVIAMQSPDGVEEMYSSAPTRPSPAPLWRRWIVVVVMVLLALIATTAQAKPAQHSDDTITYTMKKGDTLIGIATTYFIRTGDYKRVQRLNAIANPYAIATGKVISIPRDVLRYRPIAITVASARGPVTMNNADARSAMTVAEGATVRTGAQGFATLAFDNGSRVSLPSNSAMIIRRARIYTIDNSRDVELELVSGGVRSKVQPMTRSSDRTRVRTRHSVTAVRGTEFATTLADADSGSDNSGAAGGAVLSEVYEGRIALNLAKDEIPADTPLVTAGFGVKLTPDGQRIEAALLPAPELADPSKVQMGETLQFRVAGEVAGAAGYRFELGSDASMVEQLTDDRSTDGTITLPALPDGRYYLRLSAIDRHGFIGQPVTYAFRRVLSGATASASIDADGYLFRWHVVGERRPDVRFRMYKDDMSGAPFVDEPALMGSELRLTNLPPGRYIWQIGTRLVDEGDVIENWSAPETLIVSP